MKKIDKLVIYSFISPLVIWTLVAMFIFNMQFLWKYIDDIIGKGLDLSIIFELLFYQSLAMIPRAMVFGVLIASVMTLGNLAEHYELVSMKTAGVSLLRVMSPLIFFALILAGISFLFSNSLIPVTALKFKSTLYDIRRQKPALSFEEGQFNNDFKKVSIFVAKKGADGKILEDLKIYDHTSSAGYKGQTNAKRGGLFYTKDTILKKIKTPFNDTIIEKDTFFSRSFLVVKLMHGTRYEELMPEPEHPTAYPHIEMNFDSYTTLFDLSEFEFNETNEDLFKGHYSLLTTKQLLKAIDSLKQKRFQRYVMLKRNSDAMFQFRREGVTVNDSIETPLHRHAKLYYPPEKQNAPKVTIDSTIKHFWELIPVAKRNYIYQRAAGFCQNIKGQSHGVEEYCKTNKRIHAEHENEIHQKFSFALACLLFLFIGAPMGAIIRKGGFGWPILVGFIFFMIFFVLFLIGERLATNVEIPCWFGSWLPNLVLLPCGVFLTFKAINDSRVINFERIFSWMQAIKGKN
ncbi:LptF/LptG family permease [Aureispira]|nr:LptF/LptG family permease [Aureispira sp.]